MQHVLHRLIPIALCLCLWSAYGQNSGAPACSQLTKFELPGASIAITKAEALPAGPPAGPAGRGGPRINLPAHCRVEGAIDRHRGAAGKQYGIGFALALPEKWNGRFLFQGGGGLNGTVGLPLGAQAAGSDPALVRGFAVVSTDSGHQGSVFDGSFMEDQQASLDFFYVATGHSNLALAYIGSVFDQAAPKDAAGKPGELFSAADKQLILSSLLNACDDKDGLKDGMIFNFRGCGFKPSSLACRSGQTSDCLAPAKAAALEKAFAGPRDVRGNPIYPGFPFDTGIADSAGLPGLLFGPRIPVPMPSQGGPFDVDRGAVGLAADVNGRIGDAILTKLSTFSAHSGKLIFYHGLSDPWFSPLDTIGYYEDLGRENGGRAQVESWSRLFLSPGMGHCQGGSATLDRFDMLTAITDCVEKGTAPESVGATGAAFPGRTRPLCAYPKYAAYKGQGDPNDARNFVCRE